MSSRFTRGPWRAVLTTTRGHKVWSVRNTHRDPIAIVYTTEADARLLAASLNLLSALKHMVAIVRLRTDLRASERAKYEQAVKLLAEVA